MAHTNIAIKLPREIVSFLKQIAKDRKVSIKDLCLQILRENIAKERESQEILKQAEKILKVKKGIARLRHPLIQK